MHYTGLICYAETDNDSLSDSDEPYVVLGVVAPSKLATMTPIHEDVDAGEGLPGLIELYRGKPSGIVLSALLMEHDDENPDRYKAAMGSAVAAASGGRNRSPSCQYNWCPHRSGFGTDIGRSGPRDYRRA